MAIAAKKIVPYGINEQVGPSFLAPSFEHLLGTDDCGYDLFSLLIWGSRISLTIGFAVGILSVSGGLIWGVLAGGIGGIVDMILMRMSDVFQSIPQTPFLIVVSAYTGSSLKNIILILSIFMIPRLGRIIRGQVLSIKENTYIKAAGMFGANIFYIVKRHFIPELLPLICVFLIQMVGRAIIIEAGLAFLGLGDPTNKSWGMVIHYALESPSTYLTSSWLWRVFPFTLCVVLINIGLALLGYAVENNIDPRFKKST